LNIYVKLPDDKKCPHCDYQTDRYNMKTHLANQHGIAKQLEIREPVKSEYQGALK
jgi:hypothetical protein